MAIPLKVLISEDQEDDALLIVDELSQSGYQVDWKRIETAAEMRAALLEQTWDLIVADHDLPQFSAMGALQISKEFGLDVPFLIVSGAMCEMDAVAGMRAGVHDYLLKNNLARLGAVVDRELREAESRSHRRSAEQALRRQAQVIDQVHDAVIQTDLSGRIMKWNRGAERILGHMESEAVGRPVSMLYFEEDGVPAALELVKDRGQHQVELRIRHKTGSTRWIRKSLSLLRDQNDEPYGIVSYAQDITERKEAEFALQQSEERYRLLTESLPQMVWVARIAGGQVKIEFCNQQVLEYTGLTMEQLQAGHWRAIIHPDDDWRLGEVILRAETAGAAYEVKYRVRRISDQTWRWHLARAIPFPGMSGEMRWLGTIFDVEDQTRIEHALRQSEKLAVVGRLTSTVAHEINNPLAAVTNLLYLLQSTPLDTEQKEFLRVATEELARVSHITAQTLRFHRQSSRPSDTNVCEVIDSVLALYRGRLLNARIAVVRQYKTERMLVCCAGELRQLFANLIGNAFDAMRNGGKIVLRVSAGKDWQTGASGVRISIADTGHGMSPQIVSRIFEPFFTTKENHGTGLGLWVSKEITEKHGGKLAVRSCVRPERTGTVFFLFFPFDHVCGARNSSSATDHDGHVFRARETTSA
jgi:PAS domain S-box-containing protein